LECLGFVGVVGVCQFVGVPGFAGACGKLWGFSIKTFVFFPGSNARLQREAHRAVWISSTIGAAISGNLIIVQYPEKA